MTEVDPMIGAQLGAYRVESLLGIGGMGRVYKGVHPKIGSRVAIKVLSRECSDRRDLVERFFSEAKAVNVVAHENIVNVLDFASLPDGRPYIVMEHLDGAPLSSVIDQARRRGPLPLGSIARMAAEVLDGLAAAHAKGIIHRDLKPDNIFISPAGRAKVLDFGIAKLQPELGGSSTHTGSLLGTPQYMSPEQAAGKTVDLRADLYSMGIILFECVTLQKPFVADSLFDLLKQHIESPAPWPRTFRPDLPPEFEQVIMRALAKSPEHRFPTAQAMSLALQQATTGLPADQWAPLQPEMRPASQGWDPTPPASWGRSPTPNSPAPGGTMTDHRGGSHTPDLRRGNSAPGHAAAVGNTATVGSNTSPDPRPSQAKHLGPWIALSAIIVVGGGIAAIALATSGKSNSVATETPSNPGSADPTSPSPSPSPTVQTPTPVAPAPGPTVIAQETPTAPVSPVTRAQPAGDPDDDDDLPDLDEDTLGLVDQALAQANIPPTVRAAIKKYGSWAKIPAKERKKLAPLLLKSITGQTIDIPEPKAPPKPPSTDPTAWDPPDVAFPPKWNAKSVHADNLVAWATAIAKKYRSDAQLVRFEVDGVYADGHADVTLPTIAASSGDVDVRFMSAAPHCYFRVEVDPNEAAMREIKGFPCKQTAVPAPRCTLAKVWAKASAKHDNIAGKAANISYYANPATHQVKWLFLIYEDKTALVSEMFSDDC